MLGWLVVKTDTQGEAVIFWTSSLVMLVTFFLQFYYMVGCSITLVFMPKEEDAHISK